MRAVPGRRLSTVGPGFVRSDVRVRDRQVLGGASIRSRQPGNELRLLAVGAETRRAVGPTAWAVFEELATVARDDGRGHLVVSVDTERLARDLRLPPKQIRRAVARLRQYDLLAPDSGSRQEDVPSRYVIRASGAGLHLEPPEPAREAERSELLARLVGIGLSHQTARDLLESHTLRRIADVLDAQEAVDGDVRSPGGWVVAALRDDWDLRPILAERREAEARAAVWEREAAARRTAGSAAEARAPMVAAWCTAISSALHDAELAVAIERVTTPLGGLERRSVPVVRAQLLAWALAVHARDPDRPLEATLRDDLEGGPTPGVQLDGDLPPAPDADCRSGDLTDRIAAVFERRADLRLVSRDQASEDARVRQRGLGIDRSMHR